MLQRGLWPWRARLLPTPGTWRPARLWPLPPPPQETGSHCVGQAGLELLSSSNPPASASHSARITGVSHRVPPVLCVKLCGNVKYYQSHHYSTVVPPDDGNTISASTLMDILLMNDFKLVINKIAYDVQCPKREKPSNEHTAEMEHMKSLVHRLFTILHLEESQKKREHHLLEKIDHLKEQLQPLEQVKAGIEAHSEAKTSGLLWAGLALLSIQGGALAWLTWWVYSWDIMEPVTYFITFANSMVFFAYFIVTRQDYTYSAVKSRQFLQFFHKKSKQQHFDVQQYNKLKEDLAKAKESLKQARHSLYLQMQVEELNEKN
ncbi:calcium uniporter regulatory subunit MCUb, mitochondrial isoform X5 [Pan troglodytes]|uniref:calcium uniporter regulatory subunit MCUb, mitochondrial isoform X5 n=1 Tax=Pan troglodytes TaxID=9598 RepID=UPI0023EFE5B8|nr:calcium uniporter regulatory subunit MCUb, mitochondrial isoform X4 [Pan troglodytes]